MIGTRRKRPTDALDAIEPPNNTELATGVVSVTAVVEILGVLSESEVWLLGLLIFLPGTASALCTVQQTRFVAAWTTVFVTLTVLLRGGDVDRWLDRALLVLLTLTLAVTSVYACHRRVKREGEMLRLRSTAAAMQRHILHPLPLLTDDVLVNGVYEPVQEDRLVGGDIYEVVASPWGTRVLIGDVQGKGLAAVGAAFAVIGAFREAAHREPTLTALVDVLDDSVVRHNTYAEQSGDDERFVTALVISVDPGAEAQVVNCGHIPPRLLHDGIVTTLSLDSGVPLGLAELASEPTTVGWFTFPADSTLLLTTDGLTETRAADGTFYPVDDRLAKYLNLSPTELPPALYEDSRVFVGDRGQHDDVAILTVRRSPSR
ncbi:PP2C family protein-serine/threonine phosphatase [Streptomyces resistomycificus]|uniref:Serine/threonine protein phosphatase n=1 Tax=Streptomyces resistomycificus TaxID=67356 RepID=A0A0L8KWQ8_9ACTN|nr:PP2C family protein-serine/threonine phosphatase [Streptomyces resistomycificus]KOG30398.1 serine/threonine protein phosphatase [Streptomyces resistomycificus]KUN94970.1 serine/threonine protein phosphatase [Streptomyces resistomycificus]